jgi:hypothetical protein
VFVSLLTPGASATATGTTSSSGHPGQSIAHSGSAEHSARKGKPAGDGWQNSGLTAGSWSGTSCVDGECFVVGGSSVASLDNGTWTYSNLGSVGFLNGISCTSTTNCVAVGSSEGVGAGAANAALIETWNGSSWTLASNPTPTGSELFSVSCADATTCTAVGDDSNNNEDQPLIESLSGGVWAVAANPAPAVANNTDYLLDSVSCPDSNDCVAVGYLDYNDGTPGTTFAETYASGSWTVTPSPNGPGADQDSAASWLTGVSCVSSSQCLAVGEYDTNPNLYPGQGPDDSYNLVVEDLSGSWNIAGTPVSQGTESGYDDVSCVQTSQTLCVAVGSFYTCNIYGRLCTNYGPTALTLSSPDESLADGTWALAYPFEGDNDPFIAVSCSTLSYCGAIGGPGSYETWTPPTYVAMGDSFSSGAILPTVADSGDCRRSPDAYPVQYDPSVDLWRVRAQRRTMSSESNSRRWTQTPGL